MKHTRITSRYAKSLLMMSIEKKITDKILEDMQTIYKVCIENKDFRLLLNSPIIKTDKKLTVINKVFETKLNELTMMFIRIITNKKRELYLEGISQQFIKQYKSYKNIEEASITTAFKIDEEIRKEILDFISKHTENKIELQEKINDSLIGGAVIKIGDKQLDTSISKTIKQLKQQFNKNLYIQDY